MSSITPGAISAVAPAGPSSSGLARGRGTQIFLRCPEEPDEWCFVELQGILAARSKRFDGLDLGTVTFSQHKHPILLIGNQKLEGKIVKLRKPLMICALPSTAAASPYASQDDMNHNNDDDDDGGDDGDDDHGPRNDRRGDGEDADDDSGRKRKRSQVEKNDNRNIIDVLGVVRFKYLFKHRPQPVVSAPDPSS